MIVDKSLHGTLHSSKLVRGRLLYTRFALLCPLSIDLRFLDKVKNTFEAIEGDLPDLIFTESLSISSCFTSSYSFNKINRFVSSGASYTCKHFFHWLHAQNAVFILKKKKELLLEKLSDVEIALLYLSGQQGGKLNYEDFNRFLSFQTRGSSHIVCHSQSELELDLNLEQKSLKIIATDTPILMGTMIAAQGINQDPKVCSTLWQSSGEALTWAIDNFLFMLLFHQELVCLKNDQSLILNEIPQKMIDEIDSKGDPLEVLEHYWFEKQFELSPGSEKVYFKSKGFFIN